MAKMNSSRRARTYAKAPVICRDLEIVIGKLIDAAGEIDEHERDLTLFEAIKMVRFAQHELGFVEFLDPDQPALAVTS